MAAKRFILVVNPCSGRRRAPAVLRRVRPVFEDAGVDLDVRVTEHPGHAREIAKTVELDGYDGFCMIGGDGTVHEIADGLMQRGEPVSTALGIIPAGTGNTLHLHVHGGRGPVETARRIVAGKTLPLDVARTKLADREVFCVNIIGFGGVSDINVTAERLRMLGKPRYSVAALWHMVRPKRRRARLVLDGQTFDDEFLLVIACNAKYTGSGTKLAPRAELDDDLIDVVVVRKASRLQMLRLFAKAFRGTHLALPCVEYHQVHEFSIESDDDEPLNLDGEIAGTTPVRVEMMPGALRVFA